MTFSQRTQWQREPNPLMAAFERARERGTLAANLTESNPTACDFPYPDGLLQSLSDAAGLAYTPEPLGLLSARQAVAGYLRTRAATALDPGRIGLTASTSEAYGVLFKLLADAGQSVLVPAPSYPLFDLLARLNDVRLISYPLVYDGGWRIDWVRFVQALERKTRAVIVVNPNNPTGSYIHPDDIGELNRICKDRRMAIICDEVFHEFSLMDTAAPYPSLTDNCEVLTFTLGGASKTLGLPQMKVAWMVTSGPDRQVEEALHRLEIILDTYLSVNTPVQVALPGWLARAQAINRPIRDRVRQNYVSLKQALNRENGVRLLEAQGGWYAVLELPDACSEEEWCHVFLEEDGVFVHPGYFFDFNGGAHVVLSLLLPPKVFLKGVGLVLGRVRQQAHIS